MRREYCNPVPFSDGKRHTNPDPFILSWCGKYYCYASDEFGVNVSVSEDLVHWQSEGYAISEPEYRDYWAPSVFYDNGKFYMYYSNVPEGVDDCHQEWLKLAVSDNPLTGFEYQKTFFNKFSIDSHPVLWNGKLMMFYSVNDWNGTDARRSGTSILIDEMKNMEEFAGNPREAVVPGIRQEIYEENRFGDGRDWYTIEGAAHVVRGRRFWLMYSANAYVNTDYFVGTAVAKCRENMMDMKWRKYPSETVWHPLLKKNEAVEGTGHNTVAKAPNLADDWIVYHGRFASEELIQGMEQREMRIDPLYFNGDEMLCFGPGWEPAEAPALPQISCGETPVKGITFFGQSVPYYTAQAWIRAELMHTGACWGLYLDYQDDRNYVEYRYHSGRKLLGLYVCRSGIRRPVCETWIQREFDYTVPHCVDVIRRQDVYEITLDGREKVSGMAESLKQGQVGIRPYFTEVTILSFVLSHTTFLEGNDLRNLADFYELSSCSLTDGIVPDDGRLELTCKMDDTKGYKEVFTFETISGSNTVEFLCGDRDIRLVSNAKQAFSVYHFRQDGTDVFLADGAWIRPAEHLQGGYAFRAEGVRISEYEYTLL